MDTPAPGVVKDSQPSDSEHPLPIYTPKSAGFGSPKLTQESWTNPRRSQVRQIAKASFLDDDDDTGEGADEQQNTDMMANSRDAFDNEINIDSTASEPNSVLFGESYEGDDVFNSPTPRASQAAHMPPQSAQPIPIPRSSRPDSSDPFSVFEALKKHPPAALASKKPSQQVQAQKPGATAHGMTATQGKREATTDDIAPRPKIAARKALANSKVKLSALELEEETEPEPARPGSQKTQVYDYSLPASNSNSPATSLAKKKRAPKRPAVKKSEPKANAREGRKSSAAPAKQTQAPSAGCLKQARAASAGSIHVSPDVQTEEQEDDDENMKLKEEFRGLKSGPREDEVRQSVQARAQEPSSPANEEDQDHVTISSDSTSSFPESDNTDDEDFECTRKMTPANARRRTRAAAAQSQARKEAAAEVEDHSVPISKSQRPELRDDSDQRSSGVRSKAQSRKPTRKAAAGKSNGAAAPAKPTSEPTEEMELSKTTSSKDMSYKMRSSTEKPKKIISNAERRVAANRIIKDTRQVEQGTVVPSNARSAGKGETNEDVQASEPVKKAGSSIRKPKIVAFGSDGTNKNGKSHKTTAIVNLRSQDQQLGLSDGGQPAPSKAKAAKEGQNAPKMRFHTAVKSEGSPSENSEIDQRRSGRNSQLNGERVVPRRATMLEADKNATAVHSDVDMTEPNCEVEWADATDTIIPGDAEDDTLVEDAATAAAHSHGQQKNGATHGFDANCEREVLEPLTQHVMYPRQGEHRTVLGEVDANPRIIPKCAPADFSHLTKRKLPGVTIVPKPSPEQQLPPSKTDFQSGHFPTLRMNSAALPLESEAPPMKKPRYNSARPVRVHEDAQYDSNPFRGLDSHTRGPGTQTGDNIFGPGRKGKPFESSAFAQRLIDGESADRGRGQVGPVAPATSDRAALPRQSGAPFHNPNATRSGVPDIMQIPEENQQMNDMGKRMRAALESEDPGASNPLAPGYEYGKSFVLGEMKSPWPNDAFEQGKSSELDERTRAWKKATEPYAETLGETMHKIVNTILRGLKATESAIDDVVEDYRNDGQRVVERIADKHRKEMALVVQQQEQERLRRLQAYGEARQVTETVLGQLESVDLDKIVLDMEKNSATNRLERLKQRIRDA